MCGTVSVHFKLLLKSKPKSLNKLVLNQVWVKAPAKQVTAQRCSAVTINAQVRKKVLPNDRKGKGNKIFPQSHSLLLFSFFPREHTWLQAVAKPGKEDKWALESLACSSWGGWKFGNVLDEPLSMARPIEKEAEAVTRAGEWGFGVTGLCKSYSGDNFDYFLWGREQSLEMLEVPTCKRVQRRSHNG